MRGTLFLAALVTTAGVPQSAFASSLDVLLHSRTNVPGPVVRIGDVADLSAVREADAALAQRLTGTPLSILGIGDSAVCLDRHTVQAALRRAAPAASLRVVLAGAAKCVEIVASVQRLQSEQALRAATLQWRSACQAVAEACVAQGQSDSGLGADIPVPSGTVSFEALIPANLMRAPSRVTVPVRVFVDGHHVGVVRVPIEWHALRPAWRIAVPIAGGQVLRRADLLPVRVDTREARGEGVAYDPVTRLVRATRALAIDDVVVIDAESAIAEFRAGDEVPVFAAVGNVRLSRMSTAVQDGRKGSFAFVRFADGGLLSSRVPRDSSSASIPSTPGRPH